VHRELILGLAARHSLPDIYSYRLFASSGGLISYGPDRIDQYRRAAGYIDRILEADALCQAARLALWEEDRKVPFRG
jgi:putative ABC transport system substrate-binding protein